MKIRFEDWYNNIPQGAKFRVAFNKEVNILVKSPNLIIPKDLLDSTIFYRVKLEPQMNNGEEYYVMSEVGK